MSTEQSAWIRERAVSAAISSAASRALQSHYPQRPAVFLAPALLLSQQALTCTFAVRLFASPDATDRLSCTAVFCAQLALEGMGVSAFLPYAILLTRGVYPTGSPGLDEAGAERDSSDPKAGLMTNETRYVSVPCSAHSCVFACIGYSTIAAQHPSVLARFVHRTNSVDRGSRSPRV